MKFVSSLLFFMWLSTAAFGQSVQQQWTITASGETNPNGIGGTPLVITFDTFTPCPLAASGSLSVASISGGVFGSENLLMATNSVDSSDGMMNALNGDSNYTVLHYQHTDPATDELQYIVLTNEDGTVLDVGYGASGSFGETANTCAGFTGTGSFSGTFNLFSANLSTTLDSGNFTMQEFPAIPTSPVTVYNGYLGTTSKGNTACDNGSFSCVQGTNGEINLTVNSDFSVTGGFYVDSLSGITGANGTVCWPVFTQLSTDNSFATPYAWGVGEKGIDPDGLVSGDIYTMVMADSTGENIVAFMFTGTPNSTTTAYSSTAASNDYMWLTAYVYAGPCAGQTLYDAPFKRIKKSPFEKPLPKAETPPHRSVDIPYLLQRHY